MKIKKKFLYKGIELQIIEKEEYYMNCVVPLIMTRVMTVNGYIIPVNLKHRQTLKSIIEDTINLLDGFEKRGANVIEELNKIKQS